VAARDFGIREPPGHASELFAYGTMFDPGPRLSDTLMHLGQEEGLESGLRGPSTRPGDWGHLRGAVARYHQTCVNFCQNIH
jgi:hypothetical protein